MEEILSTIGNLGMDGLYTALLASPLSPPQRLLVLGEHAGVLDLGAGRECHALLQAKVDPNFGVPAMRRRLILDHDVAIPPTTGVLRERSGFYLPNYLTMQPKADFTAIEGDDRSLDGDRLVLERYPSEAALSPPSKLGLPRSASAINILVANFLHGLRWNTDQLTSAGRGVLQSRFVWPTLVMREGVTLGTITVVPDKIDRTGRRVELLARRPILDAIF